MSQRQDRWAAVADAVNARMQALGMHQQVDLVRAAGVSDATVRVFMSGKLRGGKPPLPAKRAQVASALAWTPDSIDRLLAGDEPVEVATRPAGPLPTLNAERIEYLEAEMAALRLWREEAMLMVDSRQQEMDQLRARVASLEAALRRAG